MSLFPPPLAGALGAGGLIPFLATSAPVQLVLPFDALLKPLRNAIGRPSLNATELQVTYGCMLLSVNGAPHRGWAFVTSLRRAPAFRLVWGVTPADRGRSPRPPARRSTRSAPGSAWPTP